MPKVPELKKGNTKNLYQISMKRNNVKKMK